MMSLKSFSEVQAFLDKVLSDNGELDDTKTASPHKDFWNRMTYEEFVRGSVPGTSGPIKDPTTHQPMPILVKGDSSKSNLILALKGAAGTPFASDGAFGQMPADGPPYFTDDQIRQLAGWIDAGCPQ